jgi:hypothetical protein
MGRPLPDSREEGRVVLGSDPPRFHLLRETAGSYLCSFHQIGRNLWPRPKADGSVIP